MTVKINRNTQEQIVSVLFAAVLLVAGCVGLGLNQRQTQTWMDFAQCERVYGGINPVVLDGDDVQYQTLNPAHANAVRQCMEQKGYVVTERAVHIHPSRPSFYFLSVRPKAR